MTFAIPPGAVLYQLSHQANVRSRNWKFFCDVLAKNDQLPAGLSDSSIVDLASEKKECDSYRPLL